MKLNFVIRMWIRRRNRLFNFQLVRNIFYYLPSAEVGAVDGIVFISSRKFNK